MKSLQQKRFSETIDYTIDDTGLLITRKSRSKHVERHIAFEKIATIRSKQKHDQKAALVSMAVAFIVTLVLFIASFSDAEITPSYILVWGAIFVALCLVYWFSRIDIIFIFTTDNQHVGFFAHKPSEQEVSRFIDLLFVERTSYLISRYGNLNRNLDYSTQLGNLDWLLNAKAISKSTYDHKLAELNALFQGKSQGSPIGFSQQQP